MGAIVLNNYVASYGTDCALDAGVSISGSLDMRPQEHFTRAKRLWQPMLAEDLRDVFMLGKWGHRVKARLSHDHFLRMMRASDVTVRIRSLAQCVLKQKSNLKSQLSCRVMFGVFVVLTIVSWVGN
jgi:hypothetical protein